MSDSTFWEYAFLAVFLFALPLAILICGLLASGGVSGLLRNVGLALLATGVFIIVRQVLRTGVGDLMPGFAIPALLAVLVVSPLAAVALFRAPSPHGRRLASPHAATALLVAASLVQFAAPWMLTSGK